MFNIKTKEDCANDFHVGMHERAVYIGVDMVGLRGFNKISWDTGSRMLNYFAVAIYNSVDDFNGLIYKIGGDEFLIVFPKVFPVGAQNTANAKITSDRIVNSFLEELNGQLAWFQGEIQFHHQVARTAKRALDIEKIYKK